MRLFLAVWPPDGVLDAVAALDRPTVIGARWTTRDQWHVTLRFLGELDDEVLPSVVEAVDGLGLSPTVARAGPAVELLSPRVVSIPVGGLGELGPAVIEATAGFGRRPEDRPFRGHLTLARLKGVRRRDLAPLLGTSIDASWTVDEVHVVRSFLSPKGARYESVEVVNLG
jgi:RNA 2',3'-cyclic 3'-phosphodiesterase